MRAKIVEDLLYEQAMEPAFRTTAATLYNGSLVAVTGNGIDTRDCDEINFIVNAGIVNATVTADIVASATDDPAAAVLVAGSTSPAGVVGNAAFAAITAANDQQLHIGSLKSKNFLRYMWLRYYQTAFTANIAAIAVKGKCDRDPQAHTVTFDLNW